MTKKIYSINDIKEILWPVFSMYDVKRVLLFGSYAKDKADSNSDIDLYVDDSMPCLEFCAMYEDVKESIEKKVGPFEIKNSNYYLFKIKYFSY